MQDIKPLTGKQKQVFDFIASFVQENGFSPTLQEIADYLGKNISTAQHHVDELIKRGYLKKNSNKARGITPLSNPHHIFLLGYIAAGKGIEPMENPEEIAVPKNINIDSRYPHYALRVKGDSMIDMGVLDDDIVLIKHQMTAKDGDVVVAITENGATLKVFKKEGGKVVLEPRNKDYPKIIPQQIEVRGKFMGLIRGNI